MGGADPVHRAGHDGRRRLDLTQALFAAREVTITAVALMGGVDIVVPDDITVVVNGAGIMGAFEDNAHVQGAPGAPVVRINGVAVMGGVDVKRPKNRGANRDGQERTRSVSRVLGEQPGHLGLDEAGRTLHGRMIGDAGAPPLDLLVPFAAGPRPEHVTDADANHRRTIRWNLPQSCPASGTRPGQSSLSE